MSDDNLIPLAFAEAEGRLRRRIEKCEHFNNRIARCRRRAEGADGVAWQDSP